jgi:hypothetical protein
VNTTFVRPWRSAQAFRWRANEAVSTNEHLNLTPETGSAFDAVACFVLSAVIQRIPQACTIEWQAVTFAIESHSNLKSSD